MLLYGVVLLLWVTGRGTRYLRFIVPSWGNDPYRFWLASTALIIVGAVLTWLDVLRSIR